MIILKIINDYSQIRSKHFSDLSILQGNCFDFMYIPCNQFLLK